LQDCAIWTGSVDNLFSLACSKLSRVGCRSIVGGGVLIGQWTSIGVGGKSTRADGLMVEWLASLQRFKQAWRAGERHLASSKIFHPIFVIQALLVCSFATCFE
jgi:hypothetical protein